MNIFVDWGMLNVIEGNKKQWKTMKRITRDLKFQNENKTKLKYCREEEKKNYEYGMQK